MILGCAENCCREVIGGNPRSKAVWESRTPIQNHTRRQTSSSRIDLPSGSVAGSRSAEATLTAAASSVHDKALSLHARRPSWTKTLARFAQGAYKRRLYVSYRRTPHLRKDECPRKPTGSLLVPAMHIRVQYSWMADLCAAAFDTAIIVVWGFNQGKTMHVPSR